MLNGRCACGAMRFAVEDDFVYAGYCHCLQCRAATGSAFSAFGAIERTKLRVDDVNRCAVFRNADGDVVHFCPKCGSIVFSETGDGATVHVALGTLHDAPAARPAFHMCVAAKAPWYEINDALPQYMGRPPTDTLKRVDAADAAPPSLPQTSRTEYARRFQRVTDYIDRHLDEPVDLEVLAHTAHFSPFHFHRVFAAWMGETPGDYVRSRRLDIAATRLSADRTTSVLSIALAVGFGSGEAFARAFKLRYGHTPSAWRVLSSGSRSLRIEAVHDRNPDQRVRKRAQAAPAPITQHERSDQFLAEMNMKVRVVDFPATRVAYLRNVGPMGPTVGAFWRETVLPWLAANGLSDRPRYGMAVDDPATTAPDKMRYDACVEVPDDFVATKPAAIAVLPAGRFAVREFNGTPATITDAWNEAFRWLPSSAMQIDPRPCIEYYPAKMPVDMKTGAFECELWVPVKPL
jgi:AraC family transcriptional regulator